MTRKLIRACQVPASGALLLHPSLRPGPTRGYACPLGSSSYFLQAQSSFSALSYLSPLSPEADAAAELGAGA